MSLSLSKLNDLLKESNLFVKNFYVSHDRLKFISVFSEICSNLFMIEIPRDYSFDLPNSYYQLERMDSEDFEDNEENVAMEYAGNPDPLDTEKHYTSISLEGQIEGGQDPDDLMERYKRTVELKSLVPEDKILINCVNRQLERLYYCIENSDYKLVMFCKKYLCIYDGMRPTCYKIENIRDYSNKRQFFFSVSLKPLLKDSNLVENNFLQLNKGIQSIIEKNHAIHSKNLSLILEKNIAIERMCGKINAYKERIKLVITSYSDIFTKLRETEQRILANIQEQSNRIYNPNISQELKQSQTKHRSLENLQKVKMSRLRIQEILVNIKKRYDHLTLLSDKILFDNIVMINRIFKNFDIFENLLDDSQINF